MGLILNVGKRLSENMDAKTCLQKLKLIASVSMATVDENGNPQVRIIGVMHVEDNKLYFLTARGKPFYRELINTQKVAVLGISRYKETIRLSGTPELINPDEQGRWLEIIFEENPYMKNVYPGDTRDILEVFFIQNGTIEYFNLGERPIFRESYTIGNFALQEKLYEITETCIECDICTKGCPQNCIERGSPFYIKQENCLRCGACKEKCPADAIEYTVKQ